MTLETERSSSSSNVALRTPDKRPSKATTDTGTKRTVGRSRRRRPISTTSHSSASTITATTDEFEGKENYLGHRSRRRAEATTPMRKRDETNRNYIYEEEDDQFASFGKPKSKYRQYREPNCREMTRLCAEAFRDFRKAVSRTSVPSSLWSDFPELADTLVRISISKSTTMDALGLNEHTSALLGLSRRLIKDVSVEASGSSDAKGQKKDVSVADNLFAAVHILRSIAFTLSEETTIERKEALLKMFFHLISSTKTDKARTNIDKEDNERCKAIAIAGYEGLTKVLSNYSIQQSLGNGKDRAVSFSRTKIERDSSHDLDAGILFVIPSTARRKKTDSDASSCRIGSLSVRHVSTIAFQTTTTVVKAILSLKDGSSLPYANLGITFSEEFDSGRENKISRWHRIALELLKQVHSPWLMLLASASISEGDTKREILSYSKGVHRLLWDAASSRKSSSNSSASTIRKVECDCLELRKQAILLSLASTGISKLDLLIRKTSFESGCSYAWKAASVFVQHLSPDSGINKSLLSNFYEDVDDAFGRLLALNRNVPLEYVEYRMQRSLHLESISTFFESKFDFDHSDIKEDEILNGNFRILLQIANLGISSKAKIRGYLNNSQRNESLEAKNEPEMSIDPTLILEKIIYEFNWQVIHRMDEISNDSMNRILRTLCNLSLHKTLFLAMKHFDADKSLSFSIFNQLETELVVVATILTECVGPLISAFLNHNPQKVPQLADLMMECFLRPLSLYEQLYVAHFDTDNGERTYFESSINVSKYITEILTDDSMRPDDFVLPIQCMEKAAKSLYTIARKRSESSRIEDSVPPLLFSLKLYEKLEKINGQKKDYQLSSRLFLLSTTFQTMNKIQESFWISCLLIDYESEKYSVNLKDSPEQDLLTYFGNRGCGLLPPSADDVPAMPQIIRSTCRQITIDLMKAKAKGSFEESEAINYFDDFAIISTTDLLIEAFSGEDTEIRAPHPLDSIQQLLRFDKVLNQKTRLVHIFVLTDILLQFGRSVQQYSRGSDFSETQFDYVLHNYCHLYRQLQDTISDLGLGYPLIFDSLLGLVASASLVPSFSIATTAISPDWENGVNPMLVEMSMNIVKENADNLDKSSNGEDEVDWIFLGESLRIVLRNLGVMLERKTCETNCDDDLLDDCISVAERFICCLNVNGKSDILLIANHWMIWVATYLQNELENRGDRDRAAIFSLWNLALAEKIEPNHPWFRALAMSNCRNGSNLLCLKNSFGASSFDENAQRGSALWMFRKEFQLNEFRVLALESLSSDRDSFHLHMQQAEAVLNELLEYEIEKNDKLFVLYKWVLSTAYLVQTDISSAFGCFTTALKTSQLSQKCCQTILRRVSFGVTNFNDLMVAIATSNVLALAMNRYIEILSKRPKLHYRMGDHRKALAYTRSILEYLNIDKDSLTSQEDQGYSTEDLRDLLEAAPQVRLFLQMNCWASTPEITMQKFSDIQSSDLDRHRPDASDRSTSSIVDSAQDMITIGDILYGESLSKRFEQKFRAFYDGAATLMTQRANDLQPASLRVPLNIQQYLGMPISDKVKLRNVRRSIEAPHESDTEPEVSIRQLCSEIEGSEFALSEDKAWALYYIGVVEIESARRSGALQDLWNDDRNSQISSCNACRDGNILSARYHLTRALLLSSETSDILLRKILRSLALVEGPDTRNSIASSAGILVLRSIGQSLRRKLLLSFDQEIKSVESDSSKILKDVFAVFDGQWKSKQDSDENILLFLGDLAARTPANWRFVAPVICPSGEMLVSIIQKSDPNPHEFTISTKCIFPQNADGVYDVIMKPLDSILARVQKHLEGVDPSLVSKSDDKEAMKKKWWNERNRLDAEMCDLLEDVESQYFSKVFEIISNENNSQTSNPGENVEEFPRGNLSSRFEAAVNNSDEVEFDPEKERQEKFDSLMKLTIPKLKDRLLSVGANKAQFRKLRKADLIELLIQIEDENTKKENVEDEIATFIAEESNVSDDCLFLILDENLHRFPFEGMPMLRGKTVCRIPCLSFVLATLLELKTGPQALPFVDPKTTTYILNPENNLQATQDRLLSAIQDISSSSRWDWDGVVGKIPSSPFFSDALCRENGLMMYFGHGGAQVCFSRRKVDELIEHRGSDATEYETGNASCRATVLLMGCSSGKLVSINRKHSNSIEESPLYYEPEGVALSYLCAGAPCVVGNLWDVTDNDIDRFSIALMEDFFKGSTNNSLAKSVSISRSVCKLKHLVGCAPVCYGIPVHLLHK